MTQKRRDTVTEEQIYAAADELSASGQAVSMNSVRDIVGGSFSTLGPVIKKWKSDREGLSRDITLPDHVQDTMKRVAAELWRSATQQADAEIEKIKDEAKGETASLESEIKEYESEMQRLETLNSTTQATLAKLEAETQKFEATICNLKAENAVLESKVDDKDSLIKDLKAQLASANQQIKTFQTELIAIAKKPGKRK